MLKGDLDLARATVDPDYLAEVRRFLGLSNATGAQKSEGARRARAAADLAMAAEANRSIQAKQARTG